MGVFAFSDFLDDGKARRVTARISIHSRELGGHDILASAVYRPNHNFGPPDGRTFYIGQIEVPADGLRAGESRVTQVTFLSGPGLREVLQPGRTWRIQEGDQWVGTGELLEVVP
jgi:hypothetical protein